MTPDPHPAEPITDQLRALAARLDRLSPNWTVPERFYTERSEIVAALRRAARQAENTMTGSAHDG